MFIRVVKFGIIKGDETTPWTALGQDVCQTSEYVYHVEMSFMWCCWLSFKHSWAWQNE